MNTHPFIPTLSATDIARFWSKVQSAATLDCWLWTSARTRKGYGKFDAGKRSLRAHRVSFFLATGEWPEVVMHWCDNPPCCNPLHHRAGTVQENTQDAWTKGRVASTLLRRYRIPSNAKLTPEDVQAIRREITLGKTLRSIAPQFNVTESAISKIKIGANWRHAPDLGSR